MKVAFLIAIFLCSGFVNRANAQQSERIILDTNNPVIEKKPDSLTLRSVVVNKKKLRPLDEVNQRYTTGMFVNLTTARVLDLIHDPAPAIAIPILQYAQGRINGLMITVGAGGVVSLQSMRQTSLGGSGGNKVPIKVYLDEQETTMDNLTFIYPRDVALIKYWPPGTSQISGSGGAGVLSIYTKKVNDEK